MENIILGIETSCDETAVALVTTHKRVLSHSLSSQIKTHRAFGGVVPEIAARSHLDILPFLVQETLKEADLSLGDISAFAATCGPGLIGGVHVGASFTKTLAFSMEKPFIAINHLAAHALTIRLTHDVTFPYLLLLASGGHCQILIVNSVTDFTLLGHTLDDAAGEAFDKVGRLMGLAYPAGPAFEKLALKGNPHAYELPRPLVADKTRFFDFSFSGLKTAARHIIDKNPDYDKADLAASFQQAVSDIFTNRLQNAVRWCQTNKIPFSCLVIAGGVAANQKIRHDLETAWEGRVRVIAPPIPLCTDNGAMIAWAGAELHGLSLFHDLDFRPRPRWPLEELKK